MKVKYWLLIIVVLFGVVFFAPSVLCMNSLCKFFSFNQDTGAVGDTIGGTTAPIVGLISIFLLIWTLIEQKKSNDKQIDAVNDKVGKKILLSNPSKSSQSFATILNELEGNRDLLKQMSEDCKQRQIELSWEEKAKTMVGWYEKIVKA